MASHTFDFELVADDKASNVIRQIETELNRLRSSAQNTKAGLHLGENETVSSIETVGDKLRDISDVARNGIQNISDMIPPLKNFGELSNKYLGLAKKMGGIGAVGYAGYHIATQLRDESLKATNISTTAKSMGMTIEEETRLTGTLQQRGVENVDARQSMSSYYVELDKAIKGQNNELLASIRQIGAEIYQKKEGAVDPIKTLQSLEKAIAKMPESRNWELQSKVGLDNNLLGLMREGAFNQRLEQSDQFGLTRDTDIVEKLSTLDITLNELGAAWEGFKTKTKDSVNSVLTDKSVIDGLGGIQNILTYGPDNIAINQTLGFINGDDAKILREINNTPEFYNPLDWVDKTKVRQGMITDRLRENYTQWKKEQSSFKKEELISDNGKLSNNVVQDENYNSNRRGLRNNNPGNLIAAPNTTGRDYGNNHYYAKFANPRDGIAAMSRQLMLDAEKGLNTLDGYIRKYAPAKSGNDTQGYINRVSKGTGFGPYEILDMHNPNVLAKIIPQMIKVENIEQPYSNKQIMEGIMDSITDDRWKGLRNPTKVMEQRDMIALRDEQKQFKPQTPPTPSINSSHQVTQTVEMITRALSEALQQNAKLEITIVNADKKTTQYLMPKADSRITVSMNMP